MKTMYKIEINILEVVAGPACMCVCIYVKFGIQTEFGVFEQQRFFTPLMNLMVKKKAKRMSAQQMR